MIAVQPQSVVRSSRISTASVSPGSAPSTAIGPASGYTRSQSRPSMSCAVEPGDSWLSLTSRVSSVTVSPLWIERVGALPTSHLKCTCSFGYSCSVGTGLLSSERSRYEAAEAIRSTTCAAVNLRCCAQTTCEEETHAHPEARGRSRRSGRRGCARRSDGRRRHSRTREAGDNDGEPRSVAGVRPVVEQGALHRPDALDHA